MTRPTFLNIATTVLVAAMAGGSSCTQPSTSSSNAAGAPPRASDAATSQDARALRSAILAEGYRCAEVTRIFHQGMDVTSWDDTWSVECRGGEAYAVVVNNRAGGTTHVQTCAEVETNGGVTCWEAF